MTDIVRRRRVERVAMTAWMMLVLLIVVSVRIYVGAFVIFSPIIG